jgi:hypothetical protein
MATEHRAQKKAGDPCAWRGKALASSVQRIRGWIGSDPSRTPELADALVQLTAHRLPGDTAGVPLLDRLLRLLGGRRASHDLAGDRVPDHPAAMLEGDAVPHALLEHAFYGQVRVSTEPLLRRGPSPDAQQPQRHRVRCHVDLVADLPMGQPLPREFHQEGNRHRQPPASNPDRYPGGPPGRRP